MITKVQNSQAILHWSFPKEYEVLMGKFIINHKGPSDTTYSPMMSVNKQYRQMTISLGFAQLGVHKFTVTARASDGQESKASNIVEITLVDTPPVMPPVHPPAPGTQPTAPTGFFVE